MFGDRDITKIMYGQNAIHVPAWMVVQNQRDASIMVGASRSLAPTFNSGCIHTLMLGEVILRPHFVVASNDFAGYGAQGFITSNPSAIEWLRNGQVIVDTPFGREAFMQWR